MLREAALQRMKSKRKPGEEVVVKKVEKLRRGIIEGVVAVLIVWDDRCIGLRSLVVDLKFCWEEVSFRLWVMMAWVWTGDYLPFKKQYFLIVYVERSK